MSIPFSLRLTLFYTLVLGLALLLFGLLVYTTAEQRAYQDLDKTLSSRAASVRLGKDILTATNANLDTYPLPLSGVDALGNDGVAIEVLDEQFGLLATTTGRPNGLQTGLDLPAERPVPWDAKSARTLLQQAQSFKPVTGVYNTILYRNQSVRVYSLLNNDLGTWHIIQTAKSETEVEQSLNNLRLLLLNGGLLVLFLSLGAGWLISRSSLRPVRQMTRIAQRISDAHDFSQRVPQPSSQSRDELAELATTFNRMLASLEEVYQRQQRFITDASHELRAPITSIRCNLELLAKAPDLPAKEIHDALEDAQAEADRMGRLVHHLLLLTRYENMKQNEDYKHIQSTMVDLDTLLLDVYRQYRRSPEEDNSSGLQSRARLSLQTILPVKVYGNPDQLKQALIALLDNAFSYTAPEGYITLSLTQEDGCAVIRVSDTGMGIAAVDLPHIFERFYRSEQARASNRGGSGLGLAILKSIAQDHGGTIAVTSTPGKGSTFTLLLPCEHCDV